MHRTQVKQEPGGSSRAFNGTDPISLLWKIRHTSTLHEQDCCEHKTRRRERQACPLEPKAFTSCRAWAEAAAQSTRPQSSLSRGTMASATSSFPRGTNWLNVEESEVFCLGSVSFCKANPLFAGKQKPPLSQPFQEVHIPGVDSHLHVPEVFRPLVLTFYIWLGISRIWSILAAKSVKETSVQEHVRLAKGSPHDQRA